MAINDNLHNIYNKLAYDRKQQSAYDRYPGMYRAEVVETNDPLNIHRIRYKMPEQHDFDLKPEDCPWAVPGFQHGGKGAGYWSAPKIGDIVWISFEKQHFYSPIWVGHAEPTRRRFYKLHALFQKTQVYVDREGKPVGDDPISYEDYYPKDGRPYSLGTRDRYGNMFVMDETGFFPSEHSQFPAPAGVDGITNSNFQSQQSSPESNSPDRKMIAHVSKYGHYMILGDQGYDWQSEFSGDFDEDHEKEKQRENNLIRTLNEDVPNSADRDQRRIEFRSGYGHKFEMRDVGWSSAGPSGSNSRSNDWFESSAQQSQFSERDERWMKFRTKGGHLIQMMDMGADPSSDVFIRRNRIEEIGGTADAEDDHWQDRDARQLRFVSRYGFKFVLDDRGSDPTDAEGAESPRGNGWLIKGRRDNRGFGWEVNEKDTLNHSLMYTPKSKIMELNDRFDYMMMCTDTNSPISRDWEKLRENEFALANAMSFTPENDTYHCKLDLANNYIRMKTPGGQRNGQGFETRYEGGPNTVWTEMMDRDNRALIMNSTLRHTSWHDPREQKFIMIGDDEQVILIRNKAGKVQIHAAGNVEVKSDANITLDAAANINARAGGQFIVNAGGGQFVVDGSGAGTTGDLRASQVLAFHPGCEPGGGGGSPSPSGGVAPPYIPPAELPLTPTDRGRTFNGGFSPVDENVITGI